MIELQQTEIEKSNEEVTKAKTTMRDALLQVGALHENIKDLSALTKELQEMIQPQAH